MKKIYTHDNAFIVHNVKNLVEAQGIEVFLKNEFAQGAVGEVSAFDAWPELWVINDSDYDSALAVVNATQQADKAADWVCDNCGEVNASSFDMCWQCQHDNQCS